MKRWRSKFVFLAGAASLGFVAIPAFSQDAPESLLPPGFGNSPEQPKQQEPSPETPQAPNPEPRPAPPSSQPLPGLSSFDSEGGDTEDLLADRPPPIEIPENARRSTDFVGVLEPGNWGLGANAFAGANGRFLSTLMRRADAPLPSRWTSMLLRRALLSRVAAPSYVHPVDWVAERAWLLLRMGEADAARMLVQAVDVDQFTPKMFSVAVQTALATADPAGLCPLVAEGRKTSDEPVWTLSDAMCAALAGEATRASTLIDQARRRGPVGGIDLTLAEKVIGAGANTRRAVTVEWEDVDSINSWRFGLAAATGLPVPRRLMDGAGSHVRAWEARAPMIPLPERVNAAQTAASLGVFSNASLVEMYSLLHDNTDVTEISESVGEKLRIAYSGATPERRLSAIRDLWDDAETPVERHARTILTAVAASRIPPSPEQAEVAARLIASMLSAGMDRHAARWSDAVEAMDGEAADRAWALLAVASPQPGVEIDAGRIASYEDSDGSEGSYKTKLLFAALAGLGRIDAGDAENLAERYEVPIGRENQWTRMLDRAVATRQPGTVALLAAIGMQTPSWQGVPPSHLYRIVRALRQVGLEYEARMISAEALSRS